MKLADVYGGIPSLDEIEGYLTGYSEDISDSGNEGDDGDDVARRLPQHLSTLPTADFTGSKKPSENHSQTSTEALHTKELPFKSGIPTDTFIDDLEAYGVPPRGWESICRICQDKFVSRKELLAHAVNKHDAPMPFKCNTCGKSFIRLSVVKAHARRHNSFKPFPCTECPKRFFSANECHRHRRSYHGIKKKT